MAQGAGARLNNRGGQQCNTDMPRDFFAIARGRVDQKGSAVCAQKKEQSCATCIKAKSSKRVPSVQEPDPPCQSVSLLCLLLV